MEKVITVATKPEFLRKVLEVQVPQFKPMYQARPGMQIPIMIMEPNGPTSKVGCKIVMAKWGMQNKRGTLEVIDLGRMLKNHNYNKLIRGYRCAIPVNCFITKNDQGAWAVQLLKQRTFWLAGVYMRTGNNTIEFALLKTEAADVLSAICAEMPVLMPLDRFQQWLRAKDVYGIMSMADKSGKQWFDYFKVNPAVLKPNENKKEHLIPQGTTYQEYRQRKKQLEKINVEELRANSRGRK